MEIPDRNRMISDFVSSQYSLHQREIFSSIVTEYTDWQSSTRHPVSIRDGTMEALEDALYVAPLIETGDYHASLNSKSWFFVFDYQTKHSLYKQVSLPNYTVQCTLNGYLYILNVRIYLLMNSSGKEQCMGSN